MDRDEHKDRVYLSREPREYTKKEKFLNWLYYYKWWLLGGAALLAVLVPIVLSALGVGVVKPDYRIAVVTGYPLSDETAAALQSALEALGRDLNGDGAVVVEVRQYPTYPGASTDDVSPGYASDIRLQADFAENESHFFLLEDPAAFQRNYQILADMAGELPADYDYSDAGRTVPWAQCGVALGGEADGALEGLAFGRRGYRDTGKISFYDDYEALWRLLTGGAA